MADAYGWADVVLCRAGALTIAELAAVGVASILVPFPAAVDDHQTHNAAYLVKANAAILIQQKDLTAEYLSQLLIDFIRAPHARSRFLEMAVAARQLAKPDAAQRVASLCIEAAHA